MVRGQVQDVRAMDRTRNRRHKIRDLSHPSGVHHFSSDGEVHPVVEIYSHFAARPVGFTGLGQSTLHQKPRASVFQGVGQEIRAHIQHLFRLQTDCSP